jgi:hypothetical protein
MGVGPPSALDCSLYRRNLPGRNLPKYRVPPVFRNLGLCPRSLTAGSLLCYRCEAASKTTLAELSAACGWDCRHIGFGLILVPVGRSDNGDQAVKGQHGEHCRDARSYTRRREHIA